MKIMVVDDCSITRKLLGHYLVSKGYQVAFAENGLDAMEKIGKEGINLVLTDLNMPYMDGLELVKTLKADPNWAHIPVLMVTTEKDETEKEKALKIGASAYLIKPVTSEVISQSIKTILQDIFKEGGN